MNNRTRGSIMRKVARQAFWGVVLLYGCSAKGIAQTPVALSNSGSALYPIVISPTASAAIKTDANTLASYLQKITGGTFQVTTGDGSTGIALGTFADFNLPDAKNLWTIDDPFQWDNYIIRSHSTGLYLIGETPIAAEHAMWDLMRRVGYRQYFPGPDWEIVPNNSSLVVTVDSAVQPSFRSRIFFIQYNTWTNLVPQFNDWKAKNRMDDAFSLLTGEAYPEIIARNKATFSAHPEFLAPNHGQPSQKLIASNPGVIQVVVNDALAQIAKNPNLNTVSVEPSDDPPVQGDDPKILSPTDQAVTIANAVADALHAQYGNKYYVAMLAYKTHSPPPTIKVHPGIIVSITDGYNTSGLSTQDLISAWRNQGAIVGLYDYAAIFQWDSDMPATARVSSMPYQINLLTGTYNNRDYLIESESQDDWGRDGLFYWLKSLFLFDINETKNVSQDENEFYTNCFGAGSGPISQFFGELSSNFTGSTVPPASLTIPKLQAMYHDLDAAESMVGGDPKIIARINDLTAYCRYCELYTKLRAAAGAARSKPLEDLIRFCYRIKDMEMVSTMAVYKSVANMKGGGTIPAGVGWSTPDAQDPWKQNPPITPQELASYRHR
jgi:Domain of unknown function (DUF4838)